MPAFWAIAAGGLLGAGGSIGGGILGGQAASKAATQQQAGLYSALAQQQGTTNQLLNYFDPFRQMGLQAGRALSSELYSPQQQISSTQMTLDSLNRQLQGLQSQYEGYKTGIGIPTLTGPKASELRKPIWDKMAQDNLSQQRAIQDQIATAQSQLTQAQEQAKNPNAQADMITGNPAYQAASQAAGRRLAAQGLQGSQAAIRQEGTLAGQTYQNMIGNQLAIYQPTVGATAQIAGMVGQLGQAQAQTLGGIGQAQAQGTIGQANATNQAITGGANALSGAGSSLLNYSLYQNMMNQMNTGGGRNLDTGIPMGGAREPGQQKFGLTE